MTTAIALEKGNDSQIITYQQNIVRHSKSSAILRQKIHL